MDLHPTNTKTPSQTKTLQQLLILFNLANAKCANTPRILTLGN